MNCLVVCQLLICFGKKKLKNNLGNIRMEEFVGLCISLAYIGTSPCRRTWSMGEMESLVVLALCPSLLSQWETCSPLGLDKMNGMANLVLAFIFQGFCI